MRLASAKAFLAGLCILPTLLIAADTPRLQQKDGRFALVVDGKPFLVLGAQINNSSAWPASLPSVWPALEAMHVNTVEAPVYWEQMGLASIICVWCCSGSAPGRMGRRITFRSG